MIIENNVLRAENGKIITNGNTAGYKVILAVNDLESTITEELGEEYFFDTTPLLSIQVVDKEKLKNDKEIFNNLYEKAHETLGQTYGLYVNGELYCSTASEEDITDALCTSFNTQVNTLDKARSKQEGEIKKMVIGSIYQTLNDMNLSSTEMMKIERALRKLMKQSK
jgi:hypothetical protein